MKRFIAFLFCWDRSVRLKWDNGNWSSDFYTVQEAAYMMDHFRGYECAVLTDGILAGLKFR